MEDKLNKKKTSDEISRRNEVLNLYQRDREKWAETKSKMNIYESVIMAIYLPFGLMATFIITAVTNFLCGLLAAVVICVLALVLTIYNDESLENKFISTKLYQEDINSKTRTYGDYICFLDWEIITEKNNDKIQFAHIQKKWLNKTKCFLTINDGRYITIKITSKQYAYLDSMKKLPIILSKEEFADIEKEYGYM